MGFRLVAMSALETVRNGEQRRFHIQMMLMSEFAWLWRQAVTARITAQPEAIA